MICLLLDAVALDEILECDQIGDSFKAFIAAGQYLKTSDKLFWEKLYFRMPQSVTAAGIDASEERCASDLGSEHLLLDMNIPDRE